MLDMGFIKPVRRIIADLHPRRQSALFSATMPPEVATLAESLLNDPVRVAVAPQATTIDSIDQKVEILQTGAKRARLAEIVGDPEVTRVIVFARTKRGADRVAQNLGKDGIRAEAIHGNKAQNARQKALNLFRSGHVSVLVATDIVARGIDVPGVSHIINYDLPDEAENYVHRIGRTGRNGADGIAITLCAPDEIKKLRAVEKVTRTRLLDHAPDPRGPAGTRPASKPKRAQGKPKDTGPRADRARGRRPRKTQRAA
jgi:ATP-dependent RNA helicase RhlE